MTIVTRGSYGGPLSIVLIELINAYEVITKKQASNELQSDLPEA